MKEKLLRLRAVIDAKPVRERMSLFAMIATLIVFSVYAALLDPLFSKQKELRAQISQQSNNIEGIDAEITAAMVAYERDPDQAAKRQLASVQSETAALRVTMLNKQANLVAPDQMVPLLQTLLQNNPQLRVLSLTSAPPVSALNAPAAAGIPNTGAFAGDAIYRHGVELTVFGNYLDMLDYMRALEGMPTRLFWGKAALQVQSYPNSRLTLTLYTLSLDKKWMTL